MTDTSNPTPDDSDAPEAADARIEVLQAVYDRVSSYDDSATPERIRTELDEAIAQADVEVSEETRDRLVQHINDQGGREDVAGLL